MNIGDRIAESRKKKNLTQEQLAELMSVTRQAVSRWESGQTLPEMDRVLALTDVLEVSCDYLLKGIENQESQLAAPEVSASRLLSKVIGVPIKITFYEDVMDYELINKVCEITSFDGSWAHVAYVKKKETVTRLIPISSILSITYEKEAI